MNTEYISKCGEYKLEIVEDEYTESPNEWGNEDMFLVYDHKQFTVRRDGFEPANIFDYLMYLNKPDFTSLVDKAVLLEVEDPEQYANNEIEEWEYNKSYEYDDYYIYPVAAYIHSGVSLSLTDDFKGQSFDTCVSGFVLVKKEITDNLSHTDCDKNNPECRAERYAEGLIETWNTYLMGDVYRFTLYKADKRYSISADNFQNLIDSGHGFDDYTRNEYFTEEIEWEEIDSCGGFYGSDIKTNSILEHIDDNIEFEL